MAKISANRSVLVRLVCLLAMTLVCAMGVVQAVHAHAETSTSAHVCSICVAAHSGLNVETIAVAPILVAAELPAPTPASTGIFRPVAARFIRPPPTF